MRRVLFGVACALTLGLAWHFRCRHNRAVRHPLGGFICPDCDHTSRDIPSLENPYVAPLRKTFDRKHMSVTQSGWIQ